MPTDVSAINTIPRQGSDLFRLLIGCVFFVGSAVVVLYLRMPLPFLWIWLVALPLCLFTAMRADTVWARRLSLTSFSLALSLGLLEGVSAAFDRFKPGSMETSGTYTKGGYFIEGGDLGYAPAPGVRVNSRKTNGNELVYDVVYTISDHGVRVTKGDPNGDTWLFMGCSVMFGEGVNDDETLPSYFSAELGYTANVVNLGFHGYGPHQMLRSLETDRVRPILHGVVKQVVYEGIWSHPWRAAGHDSWDVYGPSYALTGDGVTYSGPFHSRVVGRVLKILQKSTFFQFILDRTLYRLTLIDEDIERYARILEQSARLAREKYGAGFTVVYWDEDTEPSRRVLARLRKTTLALVLVSEVIPRAEWRALTLPGDPHPRRDAHRRLAAALAARFRTAPTTAR